MLKQPDPTLQKTSRTEITSLFGEAKLVLDETPKAISPFGGLVSFISFLGQIGFARQVQQHLPFTEPTSNNAIPLAHTLTAFLMSVVVGAQRFAHCEWLRADRVLRALLGLERFPSDDTIRNFFLRFSQAHIEAFWRPLWRWLLWLVKCPDGGFALDLDSTVFCREGKQEGARKGFNPRRKDRNSHHPLLAVLAEAQFICTAGGADGTMAQHAWRSRSCRRHWPSGRRACGSARCALTAVSLTEASWISWRNARCRRWWWRG
jgi:hypothetical protein